MKEPSARADFDLPEPPIGPLSLALTEAKPLILLV
jgi:hypothetical protein